MMTLGTVQQLRQAQQGYLLGLQRRNRKDTFDYIQQAEARRDWQLCPVGIAAAERSVVPQTRVVEVAGKEPGVRVLVVHSESENSTSAACASWRWGGRAKNWKPYKPRSTRAS
jgi:hypothetical protein